MKTAKLTLLMCLVTLLSFGNISTKERAALESLYSSTQGDQWKRSWDLNQPVEQWYGVVVKDDKVIELNLEFNNLRGELPEELGDLTHIKKINFFRNEITGAIPVTISNLKSLESLNVAFNRLDAPILLTIVPGEVYPTAYNLTRNSFSI